MMPNGLMTVALGLAMQVGQPSPSETPNYPALQNAYSQHGFEGQFEQRYPFDTQQNWVHGYFQEIPAYGGHVFYRPYNYKDVLSQSQTAAGWGQSPTMPYSQQFWHRYHDQAVMLKLSQNANRTLPAQQMADGTIITYPMQNGMMVMQPGAMPPQMPMAAPGVWMQPVASYPAMQPATPQSAPAPYAGSPYSVAPNMPAMTQQYVAPQPPSLPAGWQTLPNGTIVPAGNFTPAPQTAPQPQMAPTGPVLLPGGFVAPSTNPR